MDFQSDLLTIFERHLLAFGALSPLTLPVLSRFAQVFAPSIFCSGYFLVGVFREFVKWRMKMVQDEISRRTLLRSASLAFLSATVEQAAFAADVDLPKDLDLEHFMRLAIVEAKKVPKFPFGSVIVNLKNHEVVATGTVRLNNPIWHVWHGEMTAIHNCPDVDKGFNWKEVCLFTTGESCPMCQSAAIWCGMPYVIYGSSIPFLQSCGFGDINIRSKDVAAASLHNKCRVLGPVLESECNELFLNAKKLST